MKVSVELDIASHEIPAATEFLRALRLLSSQVRVRDPPALLRSLLRRLAHAAQLESVAADVTAILGTAPVGGAGDPEAAEDREALEHLKAAFMDVLSDPICHPTLADGRRTVLPFFKLLSRLPPHARGELVAHCKREVTKALREEREGQTMRGPVFHIADAFACLMMLNHITVEGMLQVGCRLLRRPECQLAMVVTVARVVELNRDKILEQANPAQLQELASLLGQLDPQAFRYEIEYICDCLNFPRPGAPQGTGDASEGSARLSNGHLPGAPGASQLGIKPASLASPRPLTQLSSAQPQAHAQGQDAPPQPQPQPQPHGQATPHMPQELGPPLHIHAPPAPPGFPVAHHQNAPPSIPPGELPRAPLGTPNFPPGLPAQQVPLPQAPKPQPPEYASSMPQPGVHYYPPTVQYGPQYSTHYATQYPAPAPQFAGGDFVVPPRFRNGTPETALASQPQYPSAASHDAYTGTPPLLYGNSAFPQGAPGAYQYPQGSGYAPQSNPYAQTSPVPAGTEGSSSHKPSSQAGGSGVQTDGFQGQPGDGASAGSGPRETQPEGVEGQPQHPASQPGTSGRQPGTEEAQGSGALVRSTGDASEKASDAEGAESEGSATGAMGHVPPTRKKTLQAVPGGGWFAGAKITCLATVTSAASQQSLVSADDEGTVAAWHSSGKVSSSWNVSPLFVSTMDSIPGTSSLLACAGKKSTSIANWMLHLCLSTGPQGEVEEGGRLECQSITCIKATSAAVMTGAKGPEGNAGFVCQYEVLASGGIALVRTYDHHKGQVSAMSASRNDARLFFSGSLDNAIRVYDIREATCTGILGTPVTETPQPPTVFVASLDSANDFYVVSGCWAKAKQGALRLWDMRRGDAPISELPVASPVMHVAVGTSIACIAFSSLKQLGLLDWTAPTAHPPSVAYLEAAAEGGKKPPTYQVKWGPLDSVLYAARSKNRIDSFVVREE